MWLLLSFSACAPPAEDPPELVAFAAASLTDVLPALAADWQAESGHAVRLTFESSSKLAKQLESGQPADLFFSADGAWMDHLARQDLVVDRRDLLTNQLVAVVPADAAFVPASASALGDARVERIAMAGEHVPAGRYGRAALDSLGVWSAVAPRVVSGDDVRTALAWVAAGEVDVGIVYTTDAASSPGVRVAFAFPPESHAPIVYPAAVMASSTHPEEAAAFLDFCRGQGRARFEAAGFGVLP